MKTVARFIGLLRDSPTYGLDRANLMSGFTIGTAGLLLNGAVFILIAPFLIDPDDTDFRALHENLEVGQLLAVILLGGATVFATLLIPLRLATVFWGPRVGRYFDQIVLSGITPLRFVIGKALSQNLFLGLILFLLLPYFVLSLTLGGVDFGFFAACLFLVWLYCMALAMVTLWAALYLNELLASVLVIGIAGFFIGWGCVPIPIQPFVMTPAPALIHPVLTSMPSLVGWAPENFTVLFVSSAACMTAVICVSFAAIYLGPLFGIVRENSTFGEVVRPGDSKRKRWFRLRLHIQRPSEIAFFYENRSATFRASEGFIRWGAVFGGLLVLLGAAYAIFLYLVVTWGLTPNRANPGAWGSWSYEFHATCLTFHGCGLALAAIVFSHARNTTYLRIPFRRGRLIEVSRLDTTAFLLFALVSTSACIAVPFQFERLVALPQGATVLAGSNGTNRPIDFVRVSFEGSLALLVAGLVVYACCRYVCLLTWLKSLATVCVAFLYLSLVCMIPMFVGVLFMEVSELRSIPVLADWAPTLSMISPFMLMMHLFNELGSTFPRDASTVPFYVAHGALLALMLLAIRRRGRKVRQMYLAGPTGRTS